MSDRHSPSADTNNINRLTQLVTLLTEQIESDHRSAAKRAFRSARAQCWNDLADRTPDADPMSQASRLAFQQLAVQDSVDVSSTFTAQHDRFAPFESFVANNDHPLRHDGELPSEGFDGTA
ncbi:MAG: hypothetical protein GEU98_24040 [Pseudonocardiaceae bacterium]|nr:hypothetical protein [Pseudonocardiaceae bacterium]